jgi:sec-independent protein translocase protein TatB
MELLGVGPLELIFIILIALVIIGPRDISKAARSAGRFLNRMYKSETWRAVTQASRNLRTLPDRLAREAELEEIRAARRELEEAANEIGQESREVQQAARKASQEVRAAAETARAGQPPQTSPVKDPKPGTTTPRSPDTSES